MIDSASSKVERAKKHIIEANELLRKARPFVYVLETDNKAHKCATYAKKNEAVVNDLGLICGDAIHNLRGALDHAWWDALFPDGKVDVPDARNAAFPFCELPERLDDIISTRLIGKPLPEIRQRVHDLKPYRGGNEMLFLLHELDLIDKHKLLVPIGDYTKINDRDLRRQVHNFPAGVYIDGATFGNNRRDIGWSIEPATYAVESDLWEKEFDVPVGVVFSMTSPNKLFPVIPTLHQLVNVVTETIRHLRS